MRLIYLFPGFVLIALAVFYPSLRGEFIMDDWGYITLSPHITDTLSPLHFWISFDSGPTTGLCRILFIGFFTACSA
jgi:hypothetical protein